MVLHSEPGLAESSADALVARIIESSPIGIAVIDFDGRYVSVNPSYAGIYGYACEQLLGASFTRLFAEAQRAPMLQRHQDFLASGGTLRGEWQVFRRDGTPLNVLADSVALESGGTRLRLVYVVDISPRTLSAQELQASEVHFRSLAKVLPVGVFRTDAEGQCIYVNERWCEISGLSAAEAHGAGWIAALHPADRERVVGKWYACASGHVGFVDEYRFQRADGVSHWVLGQAIHEVDSRGELSGYVGTITDISEHKQVESELREQASTDYLTGLCNKRAFMARIEEELARLQRLPDKPISLLMLDLDHFKAVNDTHGHAAGDALLKHFAELLRVSMRRIDRAGRLGGEEFGIILPGADLQQATYYAERLCQRLARSPAAHAQGDISFTASIGVTQLLPTDGTVEQVLARADQALYRAKALGRNCVVSIAAD